MTKALLAAACLLAGTFGAYAQGAGVPPPELPANGGAGVRTSHITATGETVPNPGESQSGGTTSLDRGIQRQDNAIDSSICKGC